MGPHRARSGMGCDIKGRTRVRSHRPARRPFRQRHDGAIDGPLVETQDWRDARLIVAWRRRPPRRNLHLSAWRSPGSPRKAPAPGDARHGGNRSLRKRRTGLTWIGDVSGFAWNHSHLSLNRPTHCDRSRVGAGKVRKRPVRRAVSSFGGRDRAFPVCLRHQAAQKSA